MSVQDEKERTSEVEEEKPVVPSHAGTGTEINAASVALAAAVASQKPNPWSRNMIKLYFIMAIGYLVSTMNGFGTFDSPWRLRAPSFGLFLAMC